MQYSLPSLLQAYTDAHIDKSSVVIRGESISSDTSSHVFQFHTCPLVPIHFFFTLEIVFAPLPWGVN